MTDALAGRASGAASVHGAPPSCHMANRAPRPPLVVAASAATVVSKACSRSTSVAERDGPRGVSHTTSRLLQSLVKMPRRHCGSRWRRAGPARRNGDGVDGGNSAAQESVASGGNDQRGPRDRLGGAGRTLRPTMRAMPRPRRRPARPDVPSGPRVGARGSSSSRRRCSAASGEKRSSWLGTNPTTVGPPEAPTTSLRCRRRPRG